MKITFSRGVIYVTAHDVIVKLSDKSRLTLKSDPEGLTLYRQGFVLAALGNGVEWSICLDNETQLIALSEAACVDIR